MQVFFITGSSSGIGKALAEKCLAEGNVVYGYSRRQTINHKNFHHTSIDLSDPEILAGFEFPDPDFSPAGIVLVNNAGTVEPVKPVGSAEPADLIRIFTLNLTAPAVLTNAFVKKYGQLECSKVVVNISSGAAQRPVDGWSAYCGTKAGLEMYTKTAALEREKGKNGFSFAAIAPGIVDTEMQEVIRSVDEHDFSRLEEFRDYKAEGALAKPGIVAERLLEEIKKIQNKTASDNVVYSIKK